MGVYHKLRVTVLLNFSVIFETELEQMNVYDDRALRNNVAEGNCRCTEIKCSLIAPSTLTQYNEYKDPIPHCYVLLSS